MAISMDDQNKFRQLFLESAHNYLSDLEKNLDLLFQDINNEEAINSIYIDAHSIKGQGFMMKYTSLAYICAAIEKIFRSRKEKTLVLTKEILLVVKNAEVIIKETLSEIEKNGSELELTKEINVLEDLIKKNNII